MRWPDLADPPAVVATCYRKVTDEEGNLVPCPRTVAVSGWLFSNNVWTFVDACEGHGLGLAESAG